ncbi:hypothetical protein EVAR_72856_1 [Eumeta japonica]|uniref:Uncharacterized protein n=1 Tax=Eumeta variegata TaxID=151549 RepID=A0A4C1TQK4_EUMVA|nr:hypothetical protein EVAR_72856_1 [Eumeta japonica]
MLLLSHGASTAERSTITTVGSMPAADLKSFKRASQVLVWWPGFVVRWLHCNPLLPSNCSSFYSGIFAYAAWRTLMHL